MKKKRPASESVLARRMAKAVAREIAKLPQGRYEAATVPYQTRSWLYEGVQDAEYDMDPYTRTELLRVSRYFEKNNWAVKRLISVWNQYTFGPNGLQMVPSTGSEDFNQAASIWWRDWSKFADLTSQQPLSVLEHVMGRRWFVDGEMWVYKTASPDTKRPRLQLIEAHRITNPGTDLINGNRVRDGIELDNDTGRPIAVHVAKNQAGSFIGGYQGSYMNSGLTGTSVPNPLISQTVEYTRVPIERMVHLYEPERAQQLRGISSLYPVLRTIQDMHELHRLEMLAAKDSARRSVYITNATGQANPRAQRAMQLAISSANAAGTAVTKPAPQFFDTVEGAETNYLRIGEDVKQFKSDRPTAAVQWYYDYLVRQICAGTGISALLVMPWSLQGTVTRADLDIMSGFFRCKSAVAIAAIRELYVWAMGWAVRFDRSLDGYPDDWAEVIARPPRSPNVDVGRNSQAVIAEYEEGFRSLQDICAELGHDWRHVLRQKAIEAKFLTSLAEEMGVEPERIAKLAQQMIAQPGQEKPEETKADPEKAEAAYTADIL